jgi:serine/threonine protein kinase
MATDVTSHNLAMITTVSQGITAIEMAEIFPPNADVHPMRVLFMIPRGPPPQLRDKAVWSPRFRDFLAKCLVKNPLDRPDSEEMLKVRTGPFVWCCIDMHHVDTTLLLLFGLL